MQKLYVPVREGLIFYNICKNLQKNGQYESLSFPTKAPIPPFCKGFLTIPVAGCGLLRSPIHPRWLASPPTHVKKYPYFPKNK